MALTILEAAKLNNGTELQQSVVEMFARESDILMALPFMDITGNALKYNREQTLPGVGFRGVNEAYTEAVGVINPIVEALSIMGGDIDVDKFIVKTMGEDQRAIQTAMKVKNLAATFTDAFINGDSTSNPRQPDGLKVRLGGAQLIAQGSTSGGDALSITKLDELIDAVDSPTHLVMSKAMRRRLTQAQRATAVGGYVTFDQDAFGRRVTKFNDLPIVVAYGNNGGTDPIAFNEANPGGGSAVGTSIYCVSLSEGMLTGIQNGSIVVSDLGEQDSAPVLRTRLEWYAGIALFHGRAAARLYGIKDAAAVA